MASWEKIKSAAAYWLIAVAMLAMGTVFATKAYRHVRYYFFTGDWPEATAKIVRHSDLSVDRTTKYPTGYLEVVYEYTVVQKNHEGKVVLDHERLPEVEAYRDEHPIGKEITIRYNPNDPAESLYRQGFGAQTFLYLAISLGGVGIFIGMTIYGLAGKGGAKE